MTWFRIGPDFVTIEVVARPNSGRCGPLRIDPRGLVIGISSPAEKGRANNELIATIAELTGVSQSAVSILRGTSARFKVMRINTAEAAMMGSGLSRSPSILQKVAKSMANERRSRSDFVDNQPAGDYLINKNDVGVCTG